MYFYFYNYIKDKQFSSISEDIKKISNHFRSLKIKNEIESYELHFFY